MNHLNRLTAPNLDLIRSQESYKSYSWRKNISGVERGGPFQLHMRKKISTNDGDSGVYYQRQKLWGGCQVKVMGGGRFMGEIETRETAEKTMSPSSLDFHTEIIVDSLYKLEEILQMA